MAKARLTKLLRNCDHEFFEVWCEWAAESIYFSGEPTQAELEEVVLLNWKEAFETFREQNKGDLKAFIKEYILVEPLKRIYTTAWEDPATI